jgi:hypothetical protein
MIVALLFSVAASWAHGPVAKQASTAIIRSVDLFLKSEKPDIKELFQSVSAKLIGEETFLVQITLKDTRAYTYECGLDKTGKKWGCRRN